MRKTGMFIVAVIFLSFATSVYFYDSMPDRVASHWNVRGEVDGYLPKFWGLFLMPLVTLGVFVLFRIIPGVDPLKKNVEKFRKYFDHFIVIIVGFLLYIYILTLLWNVGLEVNMTLGVVPAVSVVMFYAGVLMEHSKRNWFIGVRTPWTLSSDKVWEKTNKVGAKLFKIFALLMLAGMFFEKYLVFFILVPVFFVVIGVVVYSYVEYQKEKK